MGRAWRDRQCNGNGPRRLKAHAEAREATTPMTQEESPIAHALSKLAYVWYVLDFTTDPELEELIECLVMSLDDDGDKEVDEKELLTDEQL